MTATSADIESKPTPWRFIIGVWVAALCFWAVLNYLTTHNSRLPDLHVCAQVDDVTALRGKDGFGPIRILAALSTGGTAEALSDVQLVKGLKFEMEIAPFKDGRRYIRSAEQTTTCH